MKRLTLHRIASSLHRFYCPALIIHNIQASIYILLLRDKSFYHFFGSSWQADCSRSLVSDTLVFLFQKFVYLQAKNKPQDDCISLCVHSLAVGIGLTKLSQLRSHHNSITQTYVGRSLSSPCLQQMVRFPKNWLCAFHSVIKISRLSFPIFRNILEVQHYDYL